ncbi:hypothetical protein GCG21_13595 [Pseudactinotalea sp. HY160]|uniref:hypothetical protein n=1 Tax=Pseudactinotalea sp. HY160 TaxID=2654490 RepID=UPI00128E8E70|nr:hypothetical protein [Pseudactinotalea sp. HY160]MPV51020.1 hypothetical protein [Pseudactinotalea sp. HY160]
MTVTTEDVVLAAVTSIAPKGTDESDADYQTRVKTQAISLRIMTGETSPVSRAVAQIDACKVFTATVVKVVKEKSSTRGKITLKTKPSKWNEDGVEYARTERSDNPDGMAMAKRLNALKGHRVLLWVEVEEFDGGKVRVIRHVEDLGEADSDD